MMSRSPGNIPQPTQWADHAVSQAAEKKSRYYSLLYKEMADRLRAEEHLRQSNALLMALGEAQLRFVSGVPFPTLCQDLLAALLAVTQSDYGLIGEITHGVQGQGPHDDRTPPQSDARLPHCQVLAVANQHQPGYDAQDLLIHIVDRVMTLGKPVVVDAPAATLAAQYPPGVPAAPHSLLGLPCTNGDSIVGVLALANRSGFTHEVVTLLQPVLSTCAQLITTHWSEQRRKAAELALAEERASLAQRVAERTAELTHAVRAKDEFLATINHELRTPLNAILLFAEILHKQMHGPLSDRQLRAVSSIEESGHHLLTLINDILDVAKLDAGKLVLDLAPCSVEAVCQASLRLVAAMANKKEITVSLSIDPAVPVIEADERRLKQMLVNLLGNAVKFTAARGAVGLEVSGDSAANLIHLTVWDTGIGIAPEDIRNLFQPFVQLDSGHTRQFGGTGLGLALVYRMAQMHGGTISVESEVGRGSRFTLALPWCRGDVPAQLPAQRDEAAGEMEPERLPTPTPQVQTPGSQPAGDAPADRPLILIAEDNTANIAALTDFLETQQVRLVFAANGREAIDQARAHRPDLILMDIQMPEMDGLEATRRLRADAELAQTPIVALTAMVMPGDREHLLAAGMDDFIGKPIQLERLTEVLAARLPHRPLGANAGVPT